MIVRSWIVFLWIVALSYGERTNVLLICVDDLRPEIKSLGANYIHSPAIDTLVESGRAFTRHYVQAPTCGASRYALLTGTYAENENQRSNNALFSVASVAETEPFSLPRQFREKGYRTVAVGKISHHPGGLGGENWDDPEDLEMPGAWVVNLMPTNPWKHPRGAMHGYAGGKARIRGESPPVEHREGDDLTYTDGWITREALKQMAELAQSEEPFFLAVGIMKPHLPFAAPLSYREFYDGVTLPPIPHPEKPTGLSTWHRSGEFMRNYNHAGNDPRTDVAYADFLRRSYAACVTYADRQVARLLEQLEKTGLAENTIVLLWGDHGYHLGEHAIWGKHALFEESLHAPLVIRTPGMKHPGVRTDTIVETVDIYPTLCELAGIDIPSGLSGDSLVGLLQDPSAGDGIAISYWRNTETIRTSRYRLIRHQREEGPPAYELYDHDSAEGGTVNIAEAYPKIVKKLSGMIDESLSPTNPEPP